MTTSDAVIGYVDSNGVATVEDYWITAYKKCKNGGGEYRTWELWMTNTRCLR